MYMKASELIVSNPIKCYESVVSHSDIRNLLPLEWAILKTIDMYKGKDYLLKEVLDKVFSVRQVDGIVVEIIEYFRNFNLIEMGNIYFDLNDLKVNDLNLTETGLEFLKTNFIPTEEMHDNVKLYYDLISNKIIKSGKGLNSEVKGIVIKEENYNDVEYPEDLIKQYINENKSDLLQKASKTSKIIGVEEKSKETLWINKNIFLDISETGTIKICGLTKLELDVFLNEYGNKIENIFFQQNKDLENIIVLDSNILKNASESINVETIKFEIIKHLKNSPIAIINHEDFNCKQDLKNAGLSNKIVVLPKGEGENFAEEAETNLIIYDDNVFEDYIKYLDVTGKNVCKAHLRGDFYGEKITIPMGFILKNDQVEDKIDKILINVEKIIDKVTEQDFKKILYKRSLKSERELWQECCEKIEETNKDLKDKVELLTYVGKELILNSKKQNIKWLDDMAEIILFNLEERFKSLECLKKILKDINCKAIWKENRFAERLVKLMEERLIQVSSYKELLETNSFIHELGVNNTINIRKYNKMIIQDLLNKYNSEEINCVRDLTIIEKNLKKFKTLEKILLQKYKFNEAFVEGDVKNRIKEIDIEAALSLIEDWNKILDELMESDENFEDVYNKSFLQEKTEFLNCYGEFLRKYSCRIPNGYRKTFIIDTNVLINDPEIINNVKEDEYIILPKKVIDELDKKKLDKNIKEDARNAIRNLNRYTGRNIAYEEGNMKLLSDDYDKSADNLILSIALKYKTAKPQIITDDNGLQLKSKSEGVEVMTGAEFINRKEEKNSTRKSKRNKK